MCSLSWRSSHRRSFDLCDYRWWQRAIICVDWCIRVSRKLTCSPQPHSCLRAVKALLSCLHQRRHTGLLSLVRHWLWGFFSFSTALSLHLTIHSISSTTLNTTQICTVQPFPFSMILSLTCLLPPLLPNQSPVDSEVLKTISQSPALLASFLSCLSLLLLFSPSSLPLTFHSYPLSVLSLPLINPLPLPNYYKFSLTHYLLLAPRLPPPLLLIPSLSIAVSAYPPYISSAFALLSPHLQRHEYIIIYTMGPCLLFMNYQPCGQTKPIFIRNLHFISAPIRLGAKE